MNAALSIASPVGQLHIPVRWQKILADQALLWKMLRKRKRLGRGTYGAIYEIGSVAVKIGCVQRQEAQIQQWVCDQYRCALPVLAYAKEVLLPSALTREVCPEHDPLSSIARGLAGCHCNEAVGILVMPIAAHARGDMLESHREIFDPIEEAIREKFDFWWEKLPRHVMRWNGELVMTDFGEENPYW